MRPGSFRFLLPAILTLTASPLLASPHVHRGPTSPKLFKSKTKTPSKPMASIEPERATQIQNALIKQGYLTGTPSGVWDTQTESAMLKLQADNGWQTKFVPDSRAIIHLGLGPNNNASADAENAEAGVATTEPAAPVSNR